MTDLISAIQSWDTRTLLWINLDWRNPFFDWLMPFVSRFQNFQYLMAALALFLLWKGGARGRTFVASSLLLLWITDRGNSVGLKLLFDRPRPYDTLTGIYAYVSRHWVVTTAESVHRHAGSRSFPSTHAVNVWAMAVLAGLFFPRCRPYAFSFAALVSLSRVYLGEHYPLDVIGGAVVGSTAAILFYCLLKFVWKKADSQERLVWKVFPRK